MSLASNFDVVPHGIKEKNGQIYAAFKMVVGFNRPEAELNITPDLWKDIENKLNRRHWHYKLNKDQKIIDFTFQDTELESDVSIDQKPIPIEFEISSFDGPAVNDKCFQFGSEHIQDNIYKNRFMEVIIEDAMIHGLFWPAKSVEERGEAVAQKANSFKVDKSGSSKKLHDTDSDTVLGLGYEEDLKKANTYAQKLIDDAKENFVHDTRLNLENLYAKILDEPKVAEHFFGCIREFLIPINENEFFNETETIYSIQVPGKKLEDHGKDNFLLLKKYGKYYHGLKEMFLEETEFLSVNINFSDPYNNYLHDVEKQKSHPDGIYTIVEYDNDQGVIKNDPFEKPYLRGFNVLVSHNGQHYSLSLHNKKYAIKVKSDVLKNFKYPTSGVLSSKAELIIDEHTTKKSGILFTWRGDNLIVNRDLDDDQVDKVGTTIYHEDKNEGEFLKKIISEQEKLIESSQLQLIDDGNVYIFHVRKVGTTGYYLPAECEKPAPKELTFEDLLEDPYLKIFKKEKFNVKDVSQTPINTISVIGVQEYQNGNQDNVDSFQLLVLDKLKEWSEKRYLYPPFLKFEDFKYQGYLSPQKLMKEGESNIDLFASRCIKYENKANVDENEAIPPFTGRRQPINYLADIRGKYLLFVPDDLFSLKQFCQKNNFLQPVTGFAINDRHPYYLNTWSLCLALIKKDNKIDLVLERGRNSNEIILKDLSDGHYKMKVYCLDQGETPGISEIKHYNAVDIRFSILDQPEIPVITDFSSKKAIRSSLPNHKNKWNYTFKIKKDSHTWQSLKYKETNSIYEIPERNKLSEIADATIESNLLRDEFSMKSLRFEKANSDLQTSLYPSGITLRLRMKDISRYVQANYLFRYRLNQKEKLIGIVKKDDQEKIEIFHDETLVATLIVYDGKIDSVFKVKFDKEKWGYSIYHNDTPISTLTEYIDPEQTYDNLEVLPAFFQSLCFESAENKIEFERSLDYEFIVDRGSPFYLEKDLRLFASSINQAYYPLTANEKPLGRYFEPFSIEIPNNTIPSPPILDADILFYNISSKDNKFQMRSTENLIRLLIDSEFIREGENTLGLIMEKVGGSSDANSAFGEDASKVVGKWAGISLKNVINFSSNSSDPREDVKDFYKKFFIKKYFNDDPIKYYQVEDEVYQILECRPYYNSHLGKWQVLLPLDLNNSETLFFKLSAIKLAKGSDLILKEADELSPEDPYFVDPSRTNLSMVSNAVQIPAYNTKKYSIDQSINEGKTSLIINNRTKNRYLDKVYFVLLKIGLGNLRRHTAKDALYEYEEFSYRHNEDSELKNGKVLKLSSLEKIQIQFEKINVKSLLILEFENHDNIPQAKTPPIDIQLPTDWDLRIGRFKLPDISTESTESYDFKKMEKETKETPGEFVEYNPIFDTIGIRLINIAEFEIR